MKYSFKKLMREQVQADLDNPTTLVHKPVPRGGWINVVRKALGMTSYQLAKRLNCGQPNIAALERREKAKTISLASLETTARAMNCKLVYFFLPEKSFEEILKQRANKIAKNLLRSVSHSMELEQQGLTIKQKKQAEKELVKELLDGNLKFFWDDSNEF